MLCINLHVFHSFPGMCYLLQNAYSNMLCCKYRIIEFLHKRNKYCVDYFWKWILIILVQYWFVGLHSIKSSILHHGTFTPKNDHSKHKLVVIPPNWTLYELQNYNDMADISLAYNCTTNSFGFSFQCKGGKSVLEELEAMILCWKLSTTNLSKLFTQ